MTRAVLSLWYGPWIHCSLQHLLMFILPTGFYRGYFVSLMTFAPSSAIWWSCYSGLLPSLNPALLLGFPLVMLQAFSGVTAAVISSLLTNPIDVIRTRLQVRVKCESTNTSYISWYNNICFFKL